MSKKPWRLNFQLRWNEDANEDFFVEKIPYFKLRRYNGVNVMAGWWRLRLNLSVYK